MKNACITIKKQIAVEGGELLLFDAFSRHGYFFDEIRILRKEEPSKLRSALISLREEYENILINVEKEGLPLVKEQLASLPNTTCLTEYAGAGVYESGKATLFLLSADETATGSGFFQDVVLGYLRKKQGEYACTVLRGVGASEARIRALITEGERRSGGAMRFFHQRRYDEDILRICYGEGASKMTVDSVVRLFADELTESIYAMEDVCLEERLVQLLKLRGKKLSVAESFTGGGIAKRITSVSGASEVYFEGINTYAEEAKIKRLGVSQYVLRTAGAVSDQTAYEMALGLLKTGDCDVSIATTGLAGPNSDRSMLPVGLCYIAVGTKEKIYVYRYKFDGDRREITEKAINYALFLAYKAIKNL